jgi:hypothetical protein
VATLLVTVRLARVLVLFHAILIVGQNKTVSAEPER